MKWKEQFRFISLDKPIKWWKERQPREQLLLIFCCVFLVGYGMYYLYIGYQQKVEELQNALKVSRDDLIWVSEKRLDLLQLKAQGGTELESSQLEAVIKSSLNQYNTNTGVTLEATEQGWKIEWQGSNPAKMMQALSSISGAGGDIEQLTFLRNANNGSMTVIITN